MYSVKVSVEKGTFDDLVSCMSIFVYGEWKRKKGKERGRQGGEEKERGLLKYVLLSRSTYVSS